MLKRRGRTFRFRASIVSFSFVLVVLRAGFQLVRSSSFCLLRGGIEGGGGLERGSSEGDPLSLIFPGDGWLSGGKKSISCRI